MSHYLSLSVCVAFQRGAAATRSKAATNKRKASSSAPLADITSANVNKKMKLAKNAKKAAKKQVKASLTMFHQDFDLSLTHALYLCSLTQTHIDAYIHTCSSMEVESLFDPNLMLWVYICACNVCV